MADFQYEKFEESTLLSQINERRSQGYIADFDGISEQSSKGEMVAALKRNDDNVASAEKPLAKGAVAIPSASPAPLHQSQKAQPADEEFTEIAIRDADGQEYAVAKHGPDAYGKTVTARNTVNFWQGTENDFRLGFRPKDSKPGDTIAATEKPKEA